MKTTSKKLILLTQFSLLLAIEAIVCFTPLGSLPIGPIVATLSHIPVIITGIVLGPLYGGLMGGFFGLFSFIVWTFIPPSPIAFVFTPFYNVGNVHGNWLSLIICFVPRILIGIFAGFGYLFFKKLFSKFDKKEILTLSITGIISSLINTILVLGGIYLFFGKEYAATIGKSFELLLGLLSVSIATNGIPEAIIAAILTYAVCRPLLKFNQKSHI